MMTQTFPTLLVLDEVLAVTRFSKSRLYRLIRQSEFPAPRRLTPGRVVWLGDEVDAWVKARLAL